MSAWLFTCWLGRVYPFLRLFRVLELAPGSSPWFPGYGLWKVLKTALGRTFGSSFGCWLTFGEVPISPGPWKSDSLEFTSLLEYVGRRLRSLAWPALLVDEDLPLSAMLAFPF